MILYCDTSALVKRYIRESDSTLVFSLFEQYPVVGVSILTYVEMASVMTKAGRLGWVDQQAIARAWADFCDHWPRYVRLVVSPGIVERGASLAWRYGLRGYDAIHLASSLTWREVANEATVFACFDKNLHEAAGREGLSAWPE